MSNTTADAMQAPRVRRRRIPRPFPDHECVVARLQGHDEHPSRSHRDARQPHPRRGAIRCLESHPRTHVSRFAFNRGRVAEAARGCGKAVVKYDIPFLVGSLHTCLTARTKQMMAHHPVEKYCVAWNLGLTETVKVLSTETLSNDLYTPKVMACLENIDSAGALKLIALHRKRRDILLNALDRVYKDGYLTPGRYSIGAKDISMCTCTCFVPMIANRMRDSHDRKRFVLEAACSMELHPDGSQLVEKNGSFSNKFCGPHEFPELWKRSCGERHELVVPGATRFSNPSPSRSTSRYYRCLANWW